MPYLFPALCVQRTLFLNTYEALHNLNNKLPYSHLTVYFYHFRLMEVIKLKINSSNNLQGQHSIAKFENKKVHFLFQNRGSILMLKTGCMDSI